MIPFDSTNSTNEWNLLLADHARIVMIGKIQLQQKLQVTNIKSATTHPPGVTGTQQMLYCTTNNTGAAQNNGLSAFAGMIISFEISFNYLASCNILTFPQ